MIRTMIAAAIVAVFVSQVALAEAPMSQAKLSHLGLSSLELVSDQQGETVRGEGFGAASITFTLNISGIQGFPTATVTGTQSNVFGQDPQTLNNTQFGGTGFGGFDDNTAPDFSTYTSTPLTIDAAFGGAVAVSSIQGFIFGNGR